MQADGPWRIQVGAFAVEANADRLWESLRTRSELAGKEGFMVSAGRLFKLQIGGYSDSAAAQRVCDALKRSGQDCIVTR